MKRLPPVSMEQLKARSPDWGSLLLQEPLSMNERAILFLMSVLNGFEEPPRSDWPQHEAEEVTFSRWALEELLQDVWDHPWTLASETLEKFASKWSFSPKPVTRMPSTGSSRSRPKPYGNFSMTSKRSSAEHNYIYERRRRCEQTGYHKHAEIAAKDHA